MERADTNRDVVATATLVIALTALFISLVTVALVLGFVFTADRPVSDFGRLIAGALSPQDP